MSQHSTNPGDRSVTELEREVDQERERVSATVDELQARASVSSIVDQVVKAVGENGGEVSRNLGRSLRDNPMAALLTGVGLAWLMAGSGRPSEPEMPDRLPSEDYPHRTGFPADKTAQTSWLGASDQDRASEEGGLGERLADAAGAVGEQVSDAAGDLRDRAADLSKSAMSALDGTGSAIRGAGSDVRQRAATAGRGAKQTGRDLQHGLEGLLDEQPLVLGALAMALGAAVGGALPRSRVEDQMFGDQSDRAMQKVQSLAQEQGTKMQAAAGAVVDEAMTIAEEASAKLGSKLPSGQEIVDAAETQVRETAERLKVAGSQPDGEPSRVRDL